MLTKEQEEIKNLFSLIFDENKKIGDIKHIPQDFIYKSKNVDKLMSFIKNKRFLILDFKTEGECY